jgi:hypothetical protein
MMETQPAPKTLRVLTRNEKCLAHINILALYVPAKTVGLFPFHEDIFHRSILPS